MKILQETTTWVSNTPNHIYLIEGTYLIGYVKKGTKEPIYFKKKLPFNKKYRTFKEIYSLPV